MYRGVALGFLLTSTKVFDIYSCTGAIPGKCNDSYTDIICKVMQSCIQVSSCHVEAA